MAETIIAVVKTSGGFQLRYASGGCRTINVGQDAEVMQFSQEGITYKQGGKTKYFNLKNGSIRVLS